MSLSRTFSSTSSDSDYEDHCFYLIRKSHGDYRDEPFYYVGVSDEELRHRLNIEFEEKVNWERYDIGFCEEDINFVAKKYIKIKPWSVLDSMIKIFKRQKSFDKKHK